jgi:hypothetical protein
MGFKVMLLIEHMKAMWEIPPASPRQALSMPSFQLRRPDGLLNLTSFLDLVAALLFHSPCKPHLISSSTRSLEPILPVTPYLGGHPTKTFHICFLHATTQIKSHPTSIVLDQRKRHSCDNPPRKIPYYCVNQSTLVIKQ